MTQHLIFLDPCYIFYAIFCICDSNLQLKFARLVLAHQEPVTAFITFQSKQVDSPRFKYVYYMCARPPCKPATFHVGPASEFQIARLRLRIKITVPSNSWISYVTILSPHRDCSNPGNPRSVIIRTSELPIRVLTLRWYTTGYLMVHISTALRKTVRTYVVEGDI